MKSRKVIISRDVIFNENEFHGKVLESDDINKPMNHTVETNTRPINTCDDIIKLKIVEEEETSVNHTNKMVEEEEETSVNHTNKMVEEEEETSVNHTNKMVEEEEETSVNHTNKMVEEEEETSVNHTNKMVEEEEETSVNHTNKMVEEEEETSVNHTNKMVEEEEETSVNHTNKMVEEEERISLRKKNAPNRYGDWVSTAIEKNEPCFFKDAINGRMKDNWIEAMKNEIESLNQNEVWDLVELPQGRKAIGCKWIYKIKINADGEVERYKARLVAQGFSQKYGIDYDETFSPVVRFESIRTIIALAATFKLKLNQMDVKTAFSNGELKEDIYMQQPEGFVVKESEKLVCRLKRSIYGLKQSARCWNTELDYHLKEMGVSQLDCDPCTYIRIVDGNVFVIAVYVDDIILAGHNDDIMNKVKIAIGKEFNVTDMGEMHHFLGVKVVQNYTVGKIWIGQSTYAKELLIRFKMEESNPTDTPVDVGMKLMKGKDGESVNKEKYQSV